MTFLYFYSIVEASITQIRINKSSLEFLIYFTPSYSTSGIRSILIHVFGSLKLHLEVKHVTT